MQLHIQSQQAHEVFEIKILLPYSFKKIQQPNHKNIVRTI